MRHRNYLGVSTECGDGVALDVNTLCAVLAGNGGDAVCRGHQHRRAEAIRGAVCKDEDKAVERDTVDRRGASGCERRVRAQEPNVAGRSG